MVKEFVVVGTQHRIAGNEGSAEGFLAAQFGIPPPMGDPEVALFHARFDRQLGLDLPVGSF